MPSPAAHPLPARAAGAEREIYNQISFGFPMSKNLLRDWLEMFFPGGDRRSDTSALVEHGLEALRRARDERAFTMGEVRRVPSRLELRIPQERFEELKEMDALRDLAYYFNDELMKDLAAGDMRTFGDHAVRVSIAPDETLQPDEIYGMVLAPESGPSSAADRAPAPSARRDSTRVLGEGEEPRTVAFDEEIAASIPTFHMVVTGTDVPRQERRLEGTCWIIGRRGSSGRPLPEGCRKVDLDLRETVSREQVAVEIDGDRVLVRKLGKAPVSLAGHDQLGEAEERVIPLGDPFYIEDFEIMITR
jgi:hypothetical protein